MLKQPQYPPHCIIAATIQWGGYCGYYSVGTFLFKIQWYVFIHNACSYMYTNM